MSPAGGDLPRVEAHSREQLRDLMRKTPHGRLSNVWQHGLDTFSAYERLVALCNSGTFEDSTPEWLKEFGGRLAQRQPPLKTMREYLIFHDCGKPFCIQSAPGGGGYQFPGHAQRSSEVWEQLEGSPDAVFLMARDMVVHTMSAEDVPEFSREPLAPALLFAAVAELEANADMIFGGKGTPSYKSKLKQVNRRAQALCKLWWPSSQSR
jgi:hypothetical protein